MADRIKARQAWTTFDGTKVLWDNGEILPEGERPAGPYELPQRDETPTVEQLGPTYGDGYQKGYRQALDDVRKAQEAVLRSDD